MAQRPPANGQARSKVGSSVCTVVDMSGLRFVPQDNALRERLRVRTDFRQVAFPGFRGDVPGGWNKACSHRATARTRSVRHVLQPVCLAGRRDVRGRGSDVVRFPARPAEAAETRHRCTGPAARPALKDGIDVILRSRSLLETVTRGYLCALPARAHGRGAEPGLRPPGRRARLQRPTPALRPART